MAFPVSPVDGEYATVNNIVYLYASATGTWTRQQGANGTGTLSTLNITSTNNATSQITGALVVAGGAGFQGNVHVNAVYSNNYKYANGSPFTTESPTSIANGNSNVNVVANANVTISSAGTANVIVVTSTGANIAGTANVTGAVALGSSLTVTGVTNLGPVGNVIITGGSSNQYLRTDGAGALSWQSLSSNSISNGNSNVTVVANANVNISSTGVANVLVITGTGVVATGIIDIDNIRLDGNTISSTNTNGNIDITPNGTGNINLNDPVQATSTIQATRFISNIADGTAPFTVTSTTQVANLNVATAGSATTAGTVTTAAQPNITGVGTLTSLTTNGRIQVTLDGSADTGVTNNTTMLELLDNGATSTPSMAFHRPSVYATKIVLNTDNILYFGGWSAAVGGQSIATGTHLPGANATYALGSTSLRWSNIWGLASSAQYADLAEMYQADAEYSPGTVMVFGGGKEITASTITYDTAVAGVISTQPAYLMNDESDRSGIWLPLALTGRVPCLVKGPVKKGDVLVTSSTPGVAEKINNQSYIPGCVIGKSLEEYLGTNITTIEVVVGRF
jgi:hypothetical protein